jgi:hypothetical protein
MRRTSDASWARAAVRSVKASNTLLGCEERREVDARAGGVKL